MGCKTKAPALATSAKIALVDRLSACGFSKIEVTSFVSPQWVPQMADAAEVMAGIDRKHGVSYAALTPNMRGFANAMQAKVQTKSRFSARLRRVLARRTLTARDLCKKASFCPQRCSQMLIYY